jgi:hypothetical protein
LKPDYQEVIDGVLQRMIRNNEFNGDEYGITRKVFGNHFKPFYFRRDGFTIVVLDAGAEGWIKSAGASKQHPEDKYNATRGNSLALSRAVEMLAIQYRDAGYKPVSNEM